MLFTLKTIYPAKHVHLPQVIDDLVQILTHVVYQDLIHPVPLSETANPDQKKPSGGSL